MFKRIPGTKDILPEEINLWQEVEKKSREVFSFYNFQEIRPPLIEDAALFNRSLGETTEIVQKQMFLVQNKEDLYALRPEGTASVVRAYIENNLDKTLGFAKFYYIGPMFRLERPQKGRLRQFHHIGCEAIGSLSARLDIEVISLADNLLKALPVDGYKIKLNSLGCAKDKAELNKILQKELRNKSGGLCEECLRRLDTNVLRILDCKNEPCVEIVKKLHLGENHLCPDCKKHFSTVREGLDSLGINYEVHPHLVRGLDYYTGTVFEITHPALGAQDAMGAGGRYNNLVKELDGPDKGAVGFAFGVERVLLAMAQEKTRPQTRLAYLITLGQTAEKEGVKLLDKLRRNGLPAETDYEEKSLKAAMRRANDLNARFVLILGDDELKKGIVALKDMKSGEQREVKTEFLLEELKQC